MILVLFLLLSCFFAVSTYAATSASVVNSLSTGQIDIQLSEYQKNQDGSESKWVENPLVMPGTKISKIPRITNRAEPCYIRARYFWREEQEWMSREMVQGIDTDKWLRKEDGFYYYKEILNSGESADFFSEIEFPADMPQSAEENTLQMEVEVDAVQGEHFTPDFQSASPWGDTRIKASRTSDGYTIRQIAAKQSSFAVEYQGGSRELFASPDDFFADFPKLMPGDSFTGTAALRNSSDHPVELYFRNEWLEDKDLLDRITIKIAVNANGKNVVLYEGSLKGDAISQDMLLCTLNAKKEGELKFTVSIPEEMDNDFSLREAAVRWIFSTEAMPKSSSNTVKPVRTGDSGRLFAYMLCAALSLGFIAIFLSARRFAGRRGK